MLVTDVEIAHFVGQYLWPLFRVSAFFLAVPVLGSKLINARARIGLSVLVSLMVVPMLPPLPAVPSLGMQSMLIIFQQILIGVAMGFSLQVAFQIFILAGQFIAMKMGLGFASMNDPSNGVTVTVISQFYLMMATLLFLTVNGHLLVIELIVDSFIYLPISETGLTPQNLWEIVSMGSWMFGGALVIALPVLTSLLVVNLAFGVMSRSAPQMNIFAVGFPITLLFGLFLMWAGLESFLPSYDLIIRDGMNMLRTLMGAP